MSGTGDGGLIDFSRACLKSGNLLDGEDPNPAWELIGHLRKPEYHTPDNIWPADNDRSSETEKSIATCFSTAFEQAENKTRNPDFDFATQFRKVARDFRLPTTSKGEDNPLHEIYNRIRDHYRVATDIDRVILVGQHDRAYSPSSSPANALLAGFLIEEKPDERYQKGEVKSTGLHVYKPQVALGVTIKKAKLAAISHKHVHIARNGTEDRLPPLFEECSVLKKAYADYIDKAVANDYIVTENFDEYLAVGDTFTYSERRDNAEAFFRSFFPDHSDIDLVLDADQDDATLEIHLPEEAESISAAQALGGFDKTVFGLNAVYSLTSPAASDVPVFE